jgi:hypothetical protein
MFDGCAYVSQPMLLREHPMMSYRGTAVGPRPGCGYGAMTLPIHRGEIGILKAAMRSTIEPYDRCFLIMEHRGAEYLGALLLSDPAFCRDICRMLIQYCGKPIREIGDIDLSHTF